MSFSFKNNEGAKFKVIFKYPVYFYYKKNGKRKRIRVGGYCSSPEGKKPIVVISLNQQPKEELITCVEEFTHAFFFEKWEKEVRPFAKTLANFLYQNGWRKLKK